MGKNPHCLSSVLFGFYQISGFVRVLSCYGKMKVRFWFSSLCRVFGSVRFGSVWVLIHNLPSLHVYNSRRIHSVSQKKSTRGFLTFFPKRFGTFSPNFTYLLFFLCTLDYNFLFNYLQLWRSHAILSATTQRAYRPMVCGHFEHMIWTGWSRLIWYNFVRVAGNWIKICRLA